MVQARDARNGVPRDAVHTLRSLPSVDSRTASLRPLPPCRYRPAEAGRRSVSMMLRSAEADPHVTEREDQAGVGPPRGSTSAGADGMQVRGSSRSSSASRLCSIDEVRCRAVAVASDRRSFLPWALFPFEVHRASVAVRRCLADTLRSRSLARADPLARATDIPPRVHTRHGPEPVWRVPGKSVRNTSREALVHLARRPRAARRSRRPVERRARWGGFTDLHGVLDVKDRSEEQSLGRTRRQVARPKPDLITSRPCESVFVPLGSCRFDLRA
jgi:hypothetical protein